MNNGHLNSFDIEKMAASFSSIFGKSEFQNVKRRDNLQSTITKTRDKADVQPLHKDTSDLNRPTDISVIQTDRSKNRSLSHLKDTRITAPHTKLNQISKLI